MRAGVGLSGHARDVQAGRPAHAGEDVAVDAAAFAEHAHRQDEGIPVEAGDAAELLVSAPIMPATRVPCQELPGDSQSVKAALPLSAGVDPVARIGRVGVAAIAVVAHVMPVDEVEAGQQLAATVAAAQIRMVVEHAGIEHGDDDAGGAAARGPRRRWR